ncbi:MAG TPA: type II toxin-antitoxin system VapC family toxin [Phycisphaerae bacterium]|nr:type II toxin-antitoxin system VapC family toxin [Phycisphaerae bacterium]
MSGRFLLDSNIVIAFFADEKVVVERVEALPQVFVPVIVVGELLYGAAKSARSLENERRVLDFSQSVSLLDVSRSTAQAYASIKNNLRTKGHPIPENDIWIAAIAKEHGLTVVTRDPHFAAVDGLTVETW